MDGTSDRDNTQQGRELVAEMQLLAFSFLSLEELIALREVSHGWCSKAETALWRLENVAVDPRNVGAARRRCGKNKSLLMSGFEAEQPCTELTDLISRNRASLTTLRAPLRRFSASFLDAVLACRSLRCLIFERHCPLSVEDAVRLISSFPLLEELEVTVHSSVLGTLFSGLPRLRRLSLDVAGPWVAPPQPEQPAELKELHTLILLTATTAAQTAQLLALFSAPAVRALWLDDSQGSASTMRVAFVPLIERFPGLTSLSMRAHELDEKEDLPAAVALLSSRAPPRWKQLSHLKLTVDESASTSCAPFLAGLAGEGRLPALTDVLLNNVRLRSEDVWPLLQSLPALTSLSLLGCELVGCPAENHGPVCCCPLAPSASFSSATPSASSSPPSRSSSTSSSSESSSTSPAAASISSPSHHHISLTDFTIMSSSCVAGAFAAAARYPNLRSISFQLSRGGSFELAPLLLGCRERLMTLLLGADGDQLLQLNLPAGTPRFPRLNFIHRSRTLQLDLQELAALARDGVRVAETP